jgi:DNA-binding transcriptional ArsR family regulator
MVMPSDTSSSLEIRRLRILYRALGDSTRLRMIGLLAEFGPMAVGELSTRVALSQPLISWHLRILRLAGVIETRKNGRETICQLRKAAFEELHEAEARLISGSANLGSAEVGSTAPPSGSEVADVR